MSQASHRIRSRIRQKLQIHASILLSWKLFISQFL
nr:MAG TPA: hypothetical protein [Caudoviricetes sp.]